MNGYLKFIPQTNSLITYLIITCWFSHPVTTYFFPGLLLGIQHFQTVRVPPKWLGRVQSWLPLVREALGGNQHCTSGMRRLPHHGPGLRWVLFPHRVIILLERACLHNRIGRNWCKFSRPKCATSQKWRHSRLLAHWLMAIVAGGWGGKAPSPISLLSMGGVCGRSLMAEKILFTGRQTCSLYLVLWLCISLLSLEIRHD